MGKEKKCPSGEITFSLRERGVTDPRNRGFWRFPNHTPILHIFEVAFISDTNAASLVEMPFVCVSTHTFTLALACLEDLTATENKFAHTVSL